MRERCKSCKTFLKDGVVDFCSKSCEKRGEVHKKILSCDFCKKKIIRIPASIKKHVFCSKKCYGKFKIGKPSPNKGKHYWNSGQFKKGNQHPLWKNGRNTTFHGYILILQPDHPCCDKKGYVLEHRYIMEKHIGRILHSEEIVHHIDENRSNNDISNLLLLPNKSAHMKLHNFIKRRND